MGCGPPAERTAGREEIGELFRPLYGAYERDGGSLRASVAGSFGDLAHMGIYRAGKKRVFCGRNVRGSVYPPGRLCGSRQDAPKSGKKAGLGQCGGSCPGMGENIAS